MERAFKYHGLGNDFIVLDRRTGLDVDAALAVRLCDRRRGVGADGVLTLLSSKSAHARMVVHNADGSLSEMCGNGIRCVAKHLAELDPRSPQALSIETGAGVLTCELTWQSGKVTQVEVDMGQARFVAEQLPSGPGSNEFIDQPVTGFAGVRGTAVSMGNPHLVLFDRPLEEAPRLGPNLERHPGFPQRTNVEWAALAGEGLKVVVWERGVGLTLACGTGACAAAAAAVKRGLRKTGAWFAVELPGGPLQIRVDSHFGVRMRGPATFVFEASVPL